MRSLLLSRLSRLCLRKPPPLGVRYLLGGARFFSETPLCHIVRANHCGSTSRDGDIGKLVIKDFSESSYGIRTLEKTVPMELMTETGTIGASHGWVATLKDGLVCLRDDLNPNASDSEPKRITLPRLDTLPGCQTQLVTNVAMSSSSPEDDEDCILAVKFVGPQLSLCRPAQKDPEWVNIRITDSGFFHSRVMYSKRYNMFSMPSSGGTHTGSWDLETHRDKPKLRKWSFINIPEFVQSEWGKLNSCCAEVQLVESRDTGDMFMVKRFRQRNNFEGGKMEEKGIMVFKLQEEMRFNFVPTYCAYYTEDLGDLCMVLSKSEPFCLQASLYDLCPNRVCFVDNSESGSMSLKYQKFKASGFSTYRVPYFIPPQTYLYANGFASRSRSQSISSALF